MKKGIIIVLITLISILTGLNNVNASENIWSDYWADLKNPSNQTATAIVPGYYGDILSSNDSYFNYSTAKTPRNITRILKYEFMMYSNYYDIVDIYNSNTNADGSIDINNALAVYLLTTNTSGALQSSNCQIYRNYGAYFKVECPIVANVQNIRGFRVNINTNSLGSYLLPSIGVGFSRDVLGYIDTSVQNNQIQQETNDILTGEQDYNTNASEEVNGKEEINDYTEKEEQLFSNLDFEGIGENEIIINPNASTFIWQMIEGLRGMSGKIILLMTSILGLGIIKMVLNR